MTITIDKKLEAMMSPVASTRRSPKYGNPHG